MVNTLQAAGWTVTLDEFPFTFIPAPTLQQLTRPATYETGAFTGSGFGVVEGNVIPVDINLVPPRASTSGCEAGRLQRGLQRPVRHRPDPARHVHIRGQGGQCSSRGG